VPFSKSVKREKRIIFLSILDRWFILVVMPKFIDLTGKKYGRLTVLERAENNAWNQTRWLCRCECGKQKVIDGTPLKDGRTQSCGCLHDSMNFKDITGQVFGRLTVIERAGTKHNCAAWKCKCVCGKEKIVSRHCLMHGTESCGCLNRERTSEASTTHGLHKHALYQTWASMKGRCENPNYTGYENYGGRGIKVCERWRHSFPNFLKDMGERPDGMTVERKNVNADYSPENCVWGTHKDQFHNKQINQEVKDLQSEVDRLRALCLGAGLRV
jgi:hypothetical protein